MPATTDAAVEAALAGDLALALDPVLLARRAGIEPDGWQARLLRSPSRRLLLNACRQSGKSTTVGVVAVHAALFQPGALVLLVSPTLRQSGELFKKALAVYRAAGRPVPADSETALTLTLDNASRIVSLPGSESTVRGYSGAALIAIDEAARVPDDLYVSLRPMVAVSGGRIVALSTPFGKRGFFHREWTEDGDAWERYEVPATVCPRIPADFLAEERRSMGPLWFASEYLCRFVETDDQVFSHADIEAAITPGVAPLFPTGGRDAAA